MKIAGICGCDKRPIFFHRLKKPILISNIHPLIHRLPSGYVKIAMENGTFIVDLPIKDGDFP